MDNDGCSSWRSAKPDSKQSIPICPPFYAWHVSDASDFSSRSEPSADQNPPQEKVVRNKAHRACDRCRELRFKCMKVNGEECSLCTKCVSSGQECTYLRPVGRPGPTPGAFKQDYKGSANNSILLIGSKSVSPGTVDTRIVQSFVKLTEPYSGSENSSRNSISLCSQEEASGSLGRILNPSWSCISGSKSPMDDMQQNVKGDVRKSHRPLLWVQTREIKDSTTVRNKKQLFAD
ncbi:hypothetical protein GGU10DRAFT_338126 [Lentinula aff. detonsa]|uniref:Zn(2)-C6 fungal-type domain-containing protein n=1 Tax=Lentinula aff. detonsa TaxID=2804958 RepID=A0AA38NU49_9AGAR|nr:hypothetical protein GGU10DRAFT_338126 [Lentinula aff. detonsa]